LALKDVAGKNPFAGILPAGFMNLSSISIMKKNQCHVFFPISTNTLTSSFGFIGRFKTWSSGPGQSC
jgi:hypothetical protein